MAIITIYVYIYVKIMVLTYAWASNLQLNFDSRGHDILQLLLRAWLERLKLIKSRYYSCMLKSRKTASCEELLHLSQYRHLQNLFIYTHKIFILNFPTCPPVKINKKYCI